MRIDMLSVLGYGEDRKSNLQLFTMQLFVLSLGFAEHINSWTIILMILVWLFTVDYSNFSYAFKSRRLALWFFAYFAWCAIGLIYTDDVSNGLRDLVLKLSFISFPFIILFNKRIDQHLLRGVIRAFYYSMFGFSIYLLISSWFALQQAGDIEFTKALNYFTYEKLAGHLGIQPIYLSMYMVFSFFAVIWDFFLEPKVKLNSKGKILCQLWAFHFYMMVVLLSSRMELMVMLLTSFIALAYYNGIKGKNWKLAIFKGLVLASMTIVLIGMFPVNKARYTEMVDLSNDYTQTKWGGRSVEVHRSWGGDDVVGSLGSHPLMVDVKYEEMS